MAKQNTLEAVNNRIVDNDEEFADGYLMRKEGRYKLWEYLDQSVTHKKQATLRVCGHHPSIGVRVWCANSYRSDATL